MRAELSDPVKNTGGILLDKTDSTLPILLSLYNKGPGLDEICHWAISIADSPPIM